MNDFYCEPCRAWTPLAPYRTASCARCGEDFTCGECGYPIDSNGDCLRYSETGINHQTESTVS